MTTTPDLTTPRDDPSLRVPTARLAEAQRVLDAALALHAQHPDLPLPKGVATTDLDILEDRRRLKHAQADVAAARHLRDVALAMARTRFVHARQADRLPLLRTLREAALAAHAAAVAVQDYDAATAVALGRLPGPTPLPALLALDEGLARLEREITPPPPPVPTPPPPGYVRVKALARFRDSEMKIHEPGVGAIDVLPEADLDKALTEQWAVPVER